MISCVALSAIMASSQVQGAPSSDAKSGVADWAEVLELAADSRIVPDPAVREAIRTTGLPWRVRDRKSKIEMVLVPAGAFVMGKSPGDKDAALDEFPAHEVVISKPFYLGRYEVTEAQWAAVTGSNPTWSEAAGQREDDIKRLMHSGLTKREAEERATPLPKPGNTPVGSVSWEAATGFCESLGLRLPTEAEWEFACRAGVRAPWYGEVDEIAWCSHNSDGRVHVGGTKRANHFGLHDMLGNVEEWVSDRYGDYPSSEVVDPVGAEVGRFRVIRGGSWYLEAKHARSSRRQRMSPDESYVVMGLRVARTP